MTRPNPLGFDPTLPQNRRGLSMRLRAEEPEIAVEKTARLEERRTKLLPVYRLPQVADRLKEAK